MDAITADPTLIRGAHGQPLKTSLIMLVNTSQQLSIADVLCLTTFFKDLIFRQSYAEHIQCHGAFSNVFIHLAKNREHLYSSTYVLWRCHE